MRGQIKYSTTAAGVAGLLSVAFVIQIHIPPTTPHMENPMHQESIYSIFDAKANAFHTPFFSTNHSTAIRSFEQAALDEGHEFNRHSEDYSLWFIGQFDAESGELSSNVPVSIANARDFVHAEEERAARSIAATRAVMDNTVYLK